MGAERKIGMRRVLAFAAFVGALSVLLSAVIAGASPTEKKKNAGAPIDPAASVQKVGGVLPVGATQKPEWRLWGVEAEAGGERYLVSFEFRPGIPGPGEVTTIEINVQALPKTPDPRFGSRVPLEDSEVILSLRNPAGHAEKARYLAHPMPMAPGRYGLHFTPSQVGLYTLLITVRHEGTMLKAEAKLPVGIWPLPRELEGSGAESDFGVRRPIKR